MAEEFPFLQAVKPRSRLSKRLADWLLDKHEQSRNESMTVDSSSANLGVQLQDIEWQSPQRREHPTAASGVFISYRRSDESGFAGRLNDKLAARFGQNQVFMDVDPIDLGVDFVQALHQTLAQCKVLLAIIGRNWLDAKDATGNRRLDQTDDFVRLEIEMALNRDVRVIPILVDSTTMPRVSDLPESIKSLAHRNGVDIRNAHFNSDCLELISTL